MKKQGKRAVDNLFDFLEIIVMAMFVVVLVFTFVFRTVNVQGQSMQDTLFENDSLVISKLLYTPKQGDIVVVNSSVLDNRIIKRIIAVEGQKVEIDNRSAIVKVNGAVLDESYIKCDGSFDDEYFDERYYNKESEVYEYEVPAGCCFVMGDNRNHSDSRLGTPPAARALLRRDGHLGRRLRPLRGDCRKIIFCVFAFFSYL